MEGYQARYELANGTRSPILDDLIEAAGGEVPEPEDEGYGELPPGDLVLEFKATISITSGKGKRGSDTRHRSTSVPIPAGYRQLAISDPLLAIEKSLGVAIPQLDISDVEWIEARFTPKG